MNCYRCKLITSDEEIKNNIIVADTNTVTSVSVSDQRDTIDTFIGIDVGKFYIDVYCSLNNKYYLKIENNRRSILKLITTLKKDIKYSDGNNIIVSLDLTGNYEVLCRNLFQSSGFTNIFLADGRKIKYFKKSKKSFSVKTDKIDTFVLASYAKKNLKDLLLYKQDNKEREILKEVAKLELRVNDLKHFLVQEKNRIQAPNTPNVILRDIKSNIKFLETRILKLEEEIIDTIESNNILSRKYNLLKEQCGIGNVVAKTLLIFLPELGTLNKNKISSLAGVWPP